MGFIYVINCKAEPKVYVGQTVKTIRQRWNDHRACARLYQRAKDEPEGKMPANIAGSVLYRAMYVHGLENFDIEPVCEVPDEELNDTEQCWIALLDCIAPKGFNLTTGGGSFRHAESTKALMRAKKQENVDAMRNIKLHGLPAKTAYRNNKAKGEQILLNKHPLCNSKTFNLRDYKSFEEMKLTVINFVDELERSGVPYQPKKGDQSLPKGLISTKADFRVNKVVEGRNYDKKFEAKSRTRDENLRLALEYLETLPKKKGLDA